MDQFLFEFPDLPEGDSGRQRACGCFVPALDAFLAAAGEGRIALLQPRSEGRWENLKGFTYHLEPELFLQAQGGCQFRFPHQELELHPGDVLLVPPGMPHRERLNNYGGRPFHNFVVMCSAQSASVHLAGALHPEERTPGVYLRRKLHDPTFYQHLIAALGAWQDHSGSDCETIRLRLLQALLLKLRDDLGRHPEPVAATERWEVCRISSLTQLAKEYLDENFPSRFPSVPEVARAVGCSPNYLSNLFRRDQGVTIKEYVNALKFDYARRMLEHSTFNVSEVAGSCGFNDVSYFSRKFRERFGINPSQIR